MEASAPGPYSQEWTYVIPDSVNELDFIIIRK